MAVRTADKTVAHCHKRIAKVARELARVNYEELMRDNLVFKAWKSTYPGAHPKRLLQLFVDRKWGLYVPAARATLAALLREPIDEATKEEIMEILVLDSTLIRGRDNPAVLAGAVVAKH